MKANGAPEKIYLPKEIDFVSAAILTKGKQDGDVEYTRTDAFIGKACAWLKENKDKYLYNKGEKDEYIPTCTGKIIEDFKKYMEGE